MIFNASATIAAVPEKIRNPKQTACTVNSTPASLPRERFAP